MPKQKGIEEVATKETTGGMPKTWADMRARLIKDGYTPQDDIDLVWSRGDALFIRQGDDSLMIPTPEQAAEWRKRQAVRGIVKQHTPQNHIETAHEDESKGTAIVPRPAPVAEIQYAQPTKLTVEAVLAHLCPRASQTEALMFVELCRARGLNPFTRDAYLVKFGEQPASVVVSKDAFTSRADRQPDYLGFEAGIVVKTKDGHVEKREGSMVGDGETLLGGWARVHRKDRRPYYDEVAMAEYAKPFASWKQMPATMIRKVALVHALREAYPSEFGGLYDQAEIAEAAEVGRGK